MEQFEIKRWFDLHLGGLDVSFTNSATWMVIAVILATAVFVFGMRQRALVPGKLQSVAEISYDLVMEEDMAFVEGSYRLPGEDWQVVIVSRYDGAEPQVVPQKWASGASGVVVWFPRSARSDSTRYLLCGGASQRVPSWTGERFRSQTYKPKRMSTP